MNPESTTIYTMLTHSGRVTHICVGNLAIIGWRQAIIWTNAGILTIGPFGTNFSEILIDILTLSFKKMSLKVSSAKWRPFCLGLNVLMFSRNHYHIANIYADTGGRQLLAVSPVDQFSYSCGLPAIMSQLHYPVARGCLVTVSLFSVCQIT